MYGLTEADLDLQKRAAAFADELIPFEVTAELAGGELPPEVTAAHAARARELGLCATNMPAKLGGGGCTALQQVLVQEQAGWSPLPRHGCPPWPPRTSSSGMCAPRCGANVRSATRSPRRARARTWRRS